MMRSRAMAFGAVVKAVAGEARAMGLEVPVFRSPPGIAGADRTVRYRPDCAVISVRCGPRPFADIVADVIEGVLLVNGIPRPHDMQVRRRLLHAVEAQLRVAA